MSAICQNFVQNAWKKELCSNCFKSKDEHQITIKRLPPPTSEIALESIIKSSMKSQSKSKHVVSFTNEISKVIGYGGEDWSEIEDDHVEETEEETDSQDTDEEFDETEKELRKITKRNTDFNTINANLLNDNSETKKSYTHLKLGKPQIDSDGRKHTLMVSVTPFGHDKKTLKPLSQIPVAKTNKDSTENKQTPYLKNEEKIIKIEEKSLLEEISETLEKSKTPIQIISRKKILTVSKVGDSQDKENEKEAIIAEKNKLNKTSIPERKNGLSRAPIIKRDQEKPAIYQTSIAKIELLNNKNLKLTKDLTNQAYKSEALNNTAENSSSENKIEDQNLPESTVKSETAIEFNLKSANLKNNIAPTHDVSTHSEDCLTASANPATEVPCENVENMHSIISQDSNCDSMPPESREQAGEPDGHADPDGNNEPPALPTTPPPLETRSSFLHGNNGDKPKLPLKPSAVLIRKPVLPTNQVHETLTHTHTLSSFSSEPRVIKEDDAAKELDLGRTPNKRKAPKPPSCDESFLKNTISIFPMLKEMEKRASSCSPQSPNGATNESPQTDTSLFLPEPVSKRVLSQSTDSLSTIGI